MSKTKSGHVHVEAGKRRRDKVRSSFISGFTEGFGGAGFVFVSGQRMPSRSVLFSRLLQVPAAKRQAIVGEEISRTVKRYMKRELVDNLSFSVWSSEDGRFRDPEMIGRNFANAISKPNV